MLTDLSVKSVPWNKTCPPVGVSSIFNERKNVDLPQPEGPMMAMTSPLRTVVLTSFKQHVCQMPCAGF